MTSDRRSVFSDNMSPQTIGIVRRYIVDRQVYVVRPLGKARVPIECPSMVFGMESPFAVGDFVALHFYENYGFIIVGKLPMPYAQAPNPEQAAGTDVTGDPLTHVTYQDPKKPDLVLNPKGDGELRIQRGETSMMLSSVGAFLSTVSKACVRMMSAALNTITDVCFKYVLQQPNLTLISEVVQDSQSTALGQPQLSLGMRLKDESEITVKVGGAVVDEQATDGLDAAFGQLMRLLLRMTPGNPTLEYTHGESRTKLQISLQQFLLQFGAATFTWSDTGLKITQGKSTVTLSAADVLEIVSGGFTLLLSGKLDITAAELAVAAPATFTTPVKIQGFDALTVYTTLNNLIIAFNAHNHLLGPLPTTPPTAAGAVTPVIPTL